MSVYEKLMMIQTEIKAPKNLRNSFGNYNYRNAEGIFEAVKPYLAKHKCSLTVEDTVEAYEGRVYIMATAKLTDIETNESVSVSAYARESESKKGMDDSQITGATSSYARKYALNGLFLLDDTKDADTDEHRKEAEARKAKATEKQEKDEQHYEEVGNMKISKIKVDSLKEKCKNDGVSLDKVCEYCKVKKPEDLTELLYSNIVNHWNDVKAKCV